MRSIPIAPTPATILTSAGAVRLDLLARALGEGITVCHVGGNLWEASSSAGGARGPYACRLFDDGGECTCLAGQHDMDDCKHRTAARAHAALLGVVLPPRPREAIYALHEGERTG